MSHNTEPHAPITCEYIQFCAQFSIACNSSFVDVLDRNDKNAVLNVCEAPLTDADVTGIAHVVSRLESTHALRALILEGNNFGAAGVQTLMSALQSNPNHIRELRLGRNRLGDAVALLIGESLRTQGCGLKVLDLCENEITAMGVQAITTAAIHKSSSIVELSFHNNKLDDDAAAHLNSALQHAPRLKHLHLGYNMLGSAGVVHLAHGLDLSTSLSTLDLTANAITYDGASALCEVLCSSRCCLQRLNLRHNQLEDSAIALFANVLRENRSLIQLFLGFMHPRPPTVAHVLDALTYNRTLLLLDIFGWKLAPKPMLTCLAKVQNENMCVAAIITDAYHGLERRLAENNAERDERGLHPIYVGPDDRDAYVATKSLRRYSRAQSRRGSRAASRNSSRTHYADERSRSGTRGRKSTTSTAVSTGAIGSNTTAATAALLRAQNDAEVEKDAGEEDSDTRPVKQQPQQEQVSYSRSSSNARQRNDNSVNHGHNHVPLQSTLPLAGEARYGRLRENDRASVVPSSRVSELDDGREDGRRGGSLSCSNLSHGTLNRSYSKPRERAATYKLDRLLREVGECVADTQPALVDIVGQLVAALRCSTQQSKAAIASLEERIETLEQRRECLCASGDKASHPSYVCEHDTHTSSAKMHDNSINSVRVNRLVKVDGQNGSYMSSDGLINRGATTPMNGGSYVSRNNSNNNSNNNMMRTSKKGVQDSTYDGDDGYIQRNAMHGTTMASARSTSVISSHTCDNSRIPRGSDFSCDWHPGSVSLQRSMSMVSFTPEIEPSPKPDIDPPRRKSMLHYI